MRVYGVLTELEFARQRTHGAEDAKMYWRERIGSGDVRVRVFAAQDNIDELSLSISLSDAGMVFRFPLDYTY